MHQNSDVLSLHYFNSWSGRFHFLEQSHTRNWVLMATQNQCFPFPVGKLCNLFIDSLCHLWNSVEFYQHSVGAESVQIVSETWFNVCFTYTEQTQWFPDHFHAFPVIGFRNTFLHVLSVKTVYVFGFLKSAHNSVLTTSNPFFFWHMNNYCINSLRTNF